MGDRHSSGPGGTSARRPLDRSPDAVLEAATQVLATAPQLSLGEVAARIGISRATLHRRYPTRRALLTALAHDAVDRVTACYADAGVPELGRGVSRGAGVDLLGRVVERLVPLGPRLMFLLHAPELDGDVELEHRVQELDAPLEAVVRRAQRDGEVDRALPAWWVLATLNAAVFTAWEQVDAGRLAPRDAGPLVLRTWLHGVRPDH
ncbi:MAG: TetR/AcrR family transcriptional regulator [Angustibacter sp.]